MTRISSITGGFSGYSSISRSFAAAGGADAEYNGATMLFSQTSAPTGWTKVTTYDDYAVRVTSGSVSTGGLINFSSIHDTKNISTPYSVPVTTGSTTLTAPQIGSHAHGSYNISGAPNLVYYAVPLTGAYHPLVSASTDAVSYTQPFGGQAHSHPDGTANSTFNSTVSFGIKYQDAILAQRDNV